MKRIFLHRYIFLCCVVLLSGCASLPNARTARLDNRRVEYALTQHETPAVIFENGLGGTMDWWAKVFPAISHDTTAFAYNRPGYGHSESVSTPRDGMHIVEELRAVLRSTGLRPPYAGRALAWRSIHAAMRPALSRGGERLDSGRLDPPGPMDRHRLPGTVALVAPGGVRCRHLGSRERRIRRR